MSVCPVIYIDSYIFSPFQLPQCSPASVTLQPAPGDTGKVSSKYATREIYEMIDKCPIITMGIQHGIYPPLIMSLPYSFRLFLIHMNIQRVRVKKKWLQGDMGIKGTEYWLLKG